MVTFTFRFHLFFFLLLLFFLLLSLVEHFLLLYVILCKFLPLFIEILGIFALFVSCFLQFFFLATTLSFERCDLLIHLLLTIVFKLFQHLQTICSFRYLLLSLFFFAHLIHRACYTALVAWNGIVFATNAYINPISRLPTWFLTDLQPPVIRALSCVNRVKCLAICRYDLACIDFGDRC